MLQQEVLRRRKQLQPLYPLPVRPMRLGPLATEATDKQPTRPSPRWPALVARDSYTLLAVFVVLLGLGLLAGLRLSVALAIGALIAGWLSSWSP